MKVIGIIGAMEEEVAMLKEKMTEVTVHHKAGMEFFRGKLNEKEAVVVRSGIGKVNAGICTQILADDFQVDAVINTGIAGSLKNEINIGDIVLSTDTMQHDVDAREFGYPLGQIPRMDTLAFPADERLRTLAAKVCREVNPEIQVFDDIRDLFAQTNEAKMRGYDKGRFSFNVKGGRCEACQGDGLKRISMHFLPDVYVPCEQCGGKRYNEETLQVTYKDKNIYDVLEMTVEDAVEFFGNLPKIKTKMKTLEDVGLGYIKLGQSATTLSGGEAQRVKLASELQKKPTGKTVYILDEPTTGLHSSDVAKLIEVLQRIVDQGDTVIIIEHNLDVIKVADYIVDLGPEGGDGGGTVVVSGTPEKVAKCEKSYTGMFLKKML